MMAENRELMAKARKELTGKWGIAVGVSFIYLIILVVLNIIPSIGWLAAIIISGPLMLGFVIFFLSLARGQEVKVGTMFEGFPHFTDALLTYLIMMVFIVLWTLLLIIPGIMKFFSYAMTFFIMADDTSINGTAAITKSKEMMQGHRMKLFYLACRFIGWMLLCILTLGIGFLWLWPYVTTTMANFYDDIRVTYETRLKQEPNTPATQE
jgi:uncharacterized membrane protein